VKKKKKKNKKRRVEYVLDAARCSVVFGGGRQVGI